MLGIKPGYSALYKSCQAGFAKESLMMGGEGCDEYLAQVNVNYAIKFVL